MAWFCWGRYTERIYMYHLCQFGTIAKLNQVHKNVTALNR